MVTDERTSSTPKSDSVTFAGADSGTAKDVLTIASGRNFAPNDEMVTYDAGGTNQATVTLYDEASGTGAANVSESNKIDSMEISPGDAIVAEDIARSDVEDDVVAVVSNNDADVTITVGGFVIGG